MANIRIYQFYQSPGANGEVTWPADVVSDADTVSVTSVTLGSTTRAFILATDGDCHVQINGATASTVATAYSLTLTSARDRQFQIGAASGQTVKFA